MLGHLTVDRQGWMVVQVPPFMLMYLVVCLRAFLRHLTRTF